MSKRNKTPASPRPWYRIVNEAASDEPSIYIYDVIDPYVVKAETLVREIAAITADTIHVRINSRGGNFFDAMAIYNALKAHPAKIVTHVDGLAASAASVVAMAGDEVRMPDDAYMMIHNAMVLVWGTADALRKQADLLDKSTGTIADIYCQKSGMKKDDCLAAMAAETWYTGVEARAAKLADMGEDDGDGMDKEDMPDEDEEEMGGGGGAGKKMPMNRFDLSMFAHAPQALLSHPAKKAGGSSTGATLPAAIAAKEPSMSTTPAPATTPAAAVPPAAPVVANSVSEPKPATIAELEAAFPNDPKFALKAAGKALTMVEAKAEYADVLAVRLAESQKKLDEVTNAAAAPVATRPGNKPLGGAVVKPEGGNVSAAAAGGDGSAKLEFNSKVRALVTAGEYDHAAAVRNVARNDPNLYERMLDEANGGGKK